MPARTPSGKAVSSAFAVAAIAFLAAIGWAIRYGVAAETQLRALVSAPAAARRELPPQRGDGHLVSVLGQDADPARRCAAAELLGKSTSIEATRAILLAMGDPAPTVQTAAARSIGAHAQRVESVLGGLEQERVIALLRSCPATQTLNWLYEFTLRARPGLAEQASRAVLPRVGPAQVRWVAAIVEKAFREPGATPSRKPLPEPVRQQVLACLRAGLDSPHESVQALFAIEIAERGGPEPTDEQVALLLSGFTNNAEFHGFFLAAGQRGAPRIEEWARMVTMGDRPSGVFWTLLAVDHAIGRGRTLALAREGLTNKEEVVRTECQRWIDDHATKER